MGTTTISLSDDAYERLKAMKREGESFSDVVRRLTAGVEIGEYYGVLDDETGSELAAVVAERRQETTDTHEDRVDRFADELSE